MKKNMLYTLQAAKEKGIEMGCAAFCAGALIAAYNANNTGDELGQYMDGDTFKRFFQAWEAEVSRLFEQESGKHGFEEFAHLLLGKTESLRKELGL